MWPENITGIEKGIYRSMNGNANELIAIGRIIKAGLPCSRVDVTSAKYDAIVDIEGTHRLLRIQIKGIRAKGTLSLKGGFRSGKQFDKNMEKRDYKYTKEDCDIILGIDSENGDCYIIPIEDTLEWGESISIKKISMYRERWSIFTHLQHQYAQ